MPSQASNEMRQLSYDVAHYMLTCSGSQHPIKKSDIVRNVLKEQSSYFHQVMQDTKKLLSEVFGVKLEEVGGTTKTYILLNSLDLSDERVQHQWSNEVSAQQILLMLVLSYIFMKGGTVKEEMVWRFLERLGLMKGRNSNRLIPHKFFGDVKKLVTQEFVQQLYLEFVRVVDSDPPKCQVSWGTRAKKEVRRKTILEFVCKMMGNCALDTWPAQYDEVREEEEERADEQEPDSE